ncbi:MAG: response regulator, partial [Pseudanabaena sp. CAN_BIN31]|nr:response regulator [Pseudanabaena sp. CAN_BIN31]
RVFESNIVGMMFTDFDGQITDANDRFLEMLGYSREDMNAKHFNWTTITPPEYLPLDLHAIQHLRINHVIEPWEKVYYHKDGHSVHVLIGVAMLSEDDCVCVIVDVSDRKQVELRLQQQAEQERLLGVITQRMRSTLNLNEVLNTSVEEIHQILNADRVLMYRVFPDGTGAAIAESVSPPWSKILNINFPEEVFPKVNYDRYIQGRIFALSDRESESHKILPCLAKFLEEIQVRAKLVVPIIQNDTLWGLLIVHQCDRPREWEEWEINLLQKIANQLVIAIQQANLYEQVQQELCDRQLAEQQLTERNQQLRVSNEELARATRLKDEFLASMSHELRTPLNAILGMTEGMQDNVFGEINDAQLKALQTIERSGSHLLELINDILDVAKIESGQLELEYANTSIESLCQSSLPFVKQQALKKRIQLETKLQPHLPDLNIDERRMRQVLINLLNNAVKFTPEGGRITLEVSYTRASPLVENIQPSTETTNYLRIDVIDTGIGIDPQNIGKLFQPFIQIDSALNRQYQGTGLGLALVKSIVEMHGGKVELTSQVGVGSCFTVLLPCTETARSPIAIESPMSSLGESIQSEQEPRLILIAEDNEANIMTISSYLTAKGYKILLASNGEEAIALAQSAKPDLILMDIQMPIMDGLEAIKKIRQIPSLVNLPIIALTALAMEPDCDRCLEAGANDYLSKPVKLKQLTKVIQQLLDPQ